MLTTAVIPSDANRRCNHLFLHVYLPLSLSLFFSLSCMLSTCPSHNHQSNPPNTNSPIYSISQHFYTQKPTFRLPLPLIRIFAVFFFLFNFFFFLFLNSGEEEKKTVFFEKLFFCCVCTPLHLFWSTGSVGFPLFLSLSLFWGMKQLQEVNFNPPIGWHTYIYIYI